MSNERLMQAIGVARAGIGAAAWVAPRIFQERAGLKPSANPQAPYLVRIAGARDLGLALGVLSAAPDARRAWAIAGLGCDLGDALAGIAGARAGYISPRSGVLLTGSAVGAVVLGAISLR